MKIINKASILFCTLTLAVTAPLFAQTSAVALMKEAEKKESVGQSIDYLKKQIPTLKGAEKRSALAFLASVQEQAGLFTDAEKTFVEAAAIGGGDAEGMPKKSNEDLVVDAVRCALSCGNYSSADSYLNSAVRNSKNENIIATVKLYEQWSNLCKAESQKDIEEPLALLTAYAKLDSMKSVRPSILLTLWHLGGEDKWASELKKSYPKSPEAAIVKGESQQLPSPFWFFVPRKGSVVPEVAGQTIAVESPAAPKSSETKTESSKEASEKPLKQQLGLFRDQANAKALVEKVTEKGFKAYITTEKRASGTTYYLVVVDENKNGTMGNELRNAGFECYPLF